MEQCELRGLTAAVGALNDEQFAGELVFTVGNHRRKTLGYLCYRNVKLA